MKYLNISILLVILLSMIGTKANAHNIAVQNADGVTIYYVWTNNNTELAVSYRGISSDSYSNEYTGNVVIPESVTYEGKTYSVTSIGNVAFSGCKGLTSITIPNSVTSIGDRAFQSCSSLTSIKVESGNTKYDSRDNCNAIIETASNTLITGCQNTIIPNSVTSIGNVAFSGCSGLTSVTIGNSVTSIGNYAFYGCSGLTSITIPNSVTSIGNYAFYGCSGLQSVVVGNGITSLPSYVFGTGKQLKSLTIGSGVLSINSDAFRSSSGTKDYNPIKTIWLTNTPPTGYTNAAGTVNYVANDLYTSLNNKTVYPFLSSIFEVNGVKYVPVSPSERTCDAIDCLYSDEAANVNIGKAISYKGVEMKVQKVHKYACYQNPFIKTVETSFVGSIEDYAFYGCSGLTSITISNSVTSIGDYAFCGCSGDFTANINNKGSIGQLAFAGSEGLKALEIGSNVTDIGHAAFQNCTGDFTANINNKGSISRSAFAGSRGLIALEIGSNVTDIGHAAFQGCTEMTTATLGASITSLGEYIFDGCSKLEGIVIPNAVTSMGAYAFRDCASMTTAKIGTGVQAINTSTFSGCASLTDMEIGSNVKTIDTYAFSNCKALSVIRIPRAVTNIKNYVFSRCSRLKTVIMDEQESELTLGSNGSSPLFAGCPLDSVYIGRNISYNKNSNYGYSPFYRNTSLRSVVITDKEEEISENEFYGCTNLKNVRIGDGVTTIGDWAFSGCSSLDYFAFGSSVKTIGKEAFSDCTALTRLISRAVTPPTCGSQALDDINKWNCTLSVPTGATTAYQQADQWKEFFFIDNNISGISKLTNTIATPNHIYDLKGRKLKEPSKGINIIGRKKVVVK